MADSSLTTEFLELLGDVREQLNFARELGVAGLETDFTAEIELTPTKPNHAPAKFQAAPKTIAPDEIYVPADIKTSAPKPKTVEKPERFASRLEKLEATKLSNFSSKTASADYSPTLKQVGNPNFESNQEENKMPETSLFGDLTPEEPKLPESTETPEDVRRDIGDCVRCPLYTGRTNIVHTDGDWKSRILFVGEAPGADEDASGKPFVGRAGQLLTKIIEAIGLKREEVLIGNVNRCRPPGNRTPTIQEARTCRQFLMREIAFARPEIIVVMGNTAMQNLLDTKEGITKIRGKFQDYYGIKVMPTFHPAYLLRDPSKKREVWEDMKIVRDELARTAK